jgi:hypothetical protein
MMARKQEVLIREVNEVLVEEQLGKLNAKYERGIKGVGSRVGGLGGNVGNGSSKNKETQEVVTKSSEGRLSQS